MIHSVKFTCVLDTNVIYPIEVRDLLFWFAHYELYTPKWSVHIFDEWKNVMARNGVPEEEILKRVEKANKAFPDALVNNYEALIEFQPQCACARSVVGLISEHFGPAGKGERGFFSQSDVTIDAGRRLGGLTFYRLLGAEIILNL